jgi:hypothetical protein
MYSLALRWIFCGQTALSLRPYNYKAHIICTGCLPAGENYSKRLFACRGELFQKAVCLQGRTIPKSEEKKIICIGLTKGGICPTPSQRYPIGTGSCLHEVL